MAVEERHRTLREKVQGGDCGKEAPFGECAMSRDGDVEADASSRHRGLSSSTCSGSEAGPGTDVEEVAQDEEEAARRRWINRRSTESASDDEVHDDRNDAIFTVEPYGGVSRSSMIESLARVLLQYAKLGEGPQRASIFHSIHMAHISILDYLVRLAGYFQCSDECLILSLVYIDRVVKMRPKFKVSNLSIHRVLLASLLAATKFQDDVFYTNSHYARVGGVPVQELNMLEAQFLRLLDWRLMVMPEGFGVYHGLIANA